MAWQIPLADIDLGPEEKEAVQSVLNSGWLTMGEVTSAFEEDFRGYLGVKHAYTVTNATAGLHLACLAVGLKPGDEVLLPSLTFVATAAAVRYAGATPVFVDITSKNDLNISVDALEESITDRTRAIMVMHYGGYPCDMHRILDLAKKHNLSVIEDAAHAPGSELDGQKIGTFGDVACFSFFSNKNMTTGEGGMVVSNDEEIAEKVRVLRSHAMTTLTWDRHRGHAWSYDVIDVGFNYRIDEIRSAIGREQLRKLDESNRSRRALTQLYHQLLDDIIPEVGVPFVNYRGISSAHLLPILLPKDSDRTKFMELMKNQGIQTSVHYPPIHQFSFYRNNPDGITSNLPITEEIASREVTLPLYAKLKEADVEQVVKSVRNAVHEMHISHQM